MCETMNIPFSGESQYANLGFSNDAALMALAAQGNPQLTRAVLMEQAAAQREMQQIANQRNLEVPKVKKRFFFSPRRIFGSKYLYNKQSHLCVVDGCDCKELIQYDNLYAKICDDETGRSLWDMYWQNPVTGEAEAFLAMDKVTSGRKMRGTYCPEHLHLFHLLCKWETEEEKENEMKPSRFKDKVKQGVSIVTVPVSIAKKNETPVPEMLQKYEPFFEMLEQDSRKTSGINIIHYKNPETGMNDLTSVHFDLRIFQKELMQMNQPTPAFQEILNQQTNEATPPVPPQQLQ
jgi:hypothetical protein